MTKAEQIAIKLAKPIEVGDYVSIRITYKKNQTVGKGSKMRFEEVENNYSGSGYVTDIIQDVNHGLLYRIDTLGASMPYEIRLEGYDSDKVVKAEYVTPTIKECGADPFKERVRVNFISTTIDGLLSRAAYGKRNDSFDKPEYKDAYSSHEDDKPYLGCTFGGFNFNPYVIDANGNKKYYQRDLVWTLEQKQLLIHSIYNGIEIGKFIIKHHPWRNIQKQMLETGHGFDYDCVDGKQRFHAILEFLQGKFTDEFGNYWNDLSTDAQSKLLRYDNLAVGEMDDNTSDKAILAAFLTLNFTGTPMSRDHIQFVQSIKV